MKSILTLILFLLIENTISIDFNQTTIVCPDGKSKCQDDSTCCQISKEGTFGCCPFKDAICCDDYEHCCPQGYKCNVQEQKCTKGTQEIPFNTQLDSSHFYPIKNNSHNYNSIVCPDGISFCPSQYTCCVMDNGKYGCCPLENAVCCTDHIHCCPQGTTCNVQKQCCESKVEDSEEKLLMDWSEKVAAHLLIKENEDLSKLEPPLLCPDQTSCPPLSSCCEFSSGHYGCCPFKDGICCNDLQYCCPHGMKCGKVKGECLNDDPRQYLTQFNWHTVELEAKIFGSYDSKEPLRDAYCPGGEVKCNNGTCCERSDSLYACCPYSNGTCCGTHGFCCPYEYDCDPKLEACIYKGDDKNLGKTLNECIDSYTKCEDDSSCCPLPDGVCCKNDFCCPKDYECVNASNGNTQCILGDIQFDAVKKINN